MRLGCVLLLAAGCSASGPTDYGTCTMPKQITLPYAAPSTIATAGPADDTSLACGAPQNLPEAVFVFTITTAGGVHVTANDNSGMGIGIDIREGLTCGGFSRFCRWSSIGSIDERVSLPGNTYVLIVERNPQGSFKLTAE